MREREREQTNAYYDVIYIDPPYNTESSAKDGNAIADDKENITNNTFIYRDKYSRSGWLNMLNERLLLAKKLLKDDGIIFVSIDDNEHAYLKILMDEIFGEENFIGNIVWKNTTGSNDTKFLKKSFEYILLYTKNINIANLAKKQADIYNKKFKHKDKHYERRGLYYLTNLDNASHRWSKSLDYVIEHNGKQYFPGENSINWKNRQNGKHAEKDWTWMWNKDKLQWGLKNDYVVFDKNKVKIKVYQFVDNNDNLVEKTQLFENFIPLEINAKNLNGTSEQKEIFNIKVFEHPKPVSLLSYLITLFPNKNARILDFFAGSGTTGHAVLELNRQDGGNRTFTLVTNNENNIATNITYERLYRINKGVGTNGELFEWSKKNEPYNSNLFVFNINYLNIGLNKTNQLNTLLQDVNKMLKDFGVQNIIQDSNNLLSKLRSLKPLEDE